MVSSPLFPNQVALTAKPHDLQRFHSGVLPVSPLFSSTYKVEHPADSAPSFVFLPQTIFYRRPKFPRFSPFHTEISTAKRFSNTGTALGTEKTVELANNNPFVKISNLKTAISVGKCECGWNLTSTKLIDFLANVRAQKDIFQLLEQDKCKLCTRQVPQENPSLFELTLQDFHSCFWFFSQRRVFQPSELFAQVNFNDFLFTFDPWFCTQFRSIQRWWDQRTPKKRSKVPARDRFIELFSTLPFKVPHASFFSEEHFLQAHCLSSLTKVWLPPPRDKTPLTGAL